MRSVLISAAVLALVPTAALAEPEAEPKPGVVWGNRVLSASPDPSAFAPVSHKLYLNPCLPNGCTIRPGTDDARSNQSSIAKSVTTLSAWSHGPEKWDALVACVRDTFRPFHIEVVTEDPGATPHFEVMVAGTSRQLNPDLDAGGVAPFVSCGAKVNNVITFVFASLTSDPEFLCGAVAQEAGHAWGLDHELLAADPMTYLDLGTSKRFQNQTAPCGELSARACACGGTTQNSYQYLLDMFGPAGLAPPSLSIRAPVPGQWVKPSFMVHAEIDSVLESAAATLSIDGTKAADMPSGPYAFATPALTPGPHMLAVHSFDSGARVASAEVRVNVTTSCASTDSCPGGMFCLSGYCMPGSTVAGGLGATCTENDACTSGICGKQEDQQRCTAPCDQGACPAGYECVSVANGGEDVCWLESLTGGCSTTGGSPFWLLAGVVGGMALVFGRGRARPGSRSAMQSSRSSRR
jgi:hypothetical protein